MRGEPKHLNTKADYEYLKANYPESIWQPAYQSLYDDRLQEFNRGELAEGDNGTVDATHSVVENKNTDGTITRYQYEKAVNPDAWIYRIGFTDAEVLAVLK